MVKVLVWNCADDTLTKHADEEIAHLEALSSKHFEVTVARQSVAWKRIAHLARGLQPTIFHFIGHGNSEGSLSTPDEDGSYWFRSGAEVIRAIRAASPGLEGVFLSACYSAKTGPDLLRPLPTAGGWAIGTASVIAGDEASDFAKSFYESLSQDPASPQQAFNIAAAYADADYPAPLHRAWFSHSPLPRVEDMARDIYAALRNLFDRDSFRVSLRYEASMSELDVALQDIVHALNTGEVKSRQDRTVIPNISFPRSWLTSDPHVEKFVRNARSGLTETRRELLTIMDGTRDLRIFGDVSNLNTATPADVWMERINRVDRARNRILAAANTLIAHADLGPFPSIAPSFSRAEIQAARP